MKSKKSIQLNQAFGAVLTLVLVALLVIIGIYLVANIQTGFPLTTANTINETGAINSTGKLLSNSTLCRFANPSIVQVFNTTSGALVPSSNYTLVGNTLYNSSASIAKWDTVKISYTYGWGDQVCIASDSIITQFGTYPALVGLVGTIIFLALVIGVLVASFAFGGKKGV